jgi:cytochrome oxidase assembly protein ShyY1
MSVLTHRPTPPRPARTARSALGLLREKSWFVALLGVIVLSVIFVFLGRWQYHRHEARSARNALVDRNYDAAPVALDALLPWVRARPATRLPVHLRWRPVQVSGSYLSDRTVLLRNRPQDGENGYDVVTPFVTAQGPVLYIDRGWIPAGTSSAAHPDRVPTAPAGTVRVVARLRPSEPPSGRRAPAGQATRLDVASLGSALGPEFAGRVVGAYGALIAETPPAAGTPSAYPRPDPGLGINLAYAVQWVGFAIAAYVLLGVAMVREVRRREGRPDPPLSERFRFLRGSDPPYDE